MTNPEYREAIARIAEPDGWDAGFARSWGQVVADIHRQAGYAKADLVIALPRPQDEGVHLHTDVATSADALTETPSPAGKLRPIGEAEAVGFLMIAANYFERRPTNGEDMAHWSNITNAENCRRTAALIRQTASALQSQDTQP
jgi:hypothetical protein